ncbi:MAG: tetraacyldisaccharide 4'-kinase [Thermodesulfobacteriota bacterium]|nr:tetraacyldisaccharide 4'-kinase [Thermodesulfobacteriota bacterium]
MSLRTFSERIIYGRYEKKYIEILLIPLLLISLLYKCGVQLRYWLYKRGIFRSKELPCEVISIGNISLGGSGKTPTTYYIANLLKENQIRVAVLSRGYKSKANNRINLVSDGNRVLLSPMQAGDEPYMLAKRLNGVPVLTSKDRYHMGKYAIKHFKSSALILDDGFQHIGLKRDMDILLIDPNTLNGQNYLFPRGILREPIKSIKRADLYLITKVKDENEYEKLSRKIRDIKEDAKTFYVYFKAEDLIDSNGENKGLDYLKDKRVLAFSGIANPQHFIALLKEQGAIVVEELIFPDHHWYSSDDYKKIERISKQLDFSVTTEKDIMKMGSSFFHKVKAFALTIGLCIDREEDFKASLLSKVLNP